MNKLTLESYAYRQPNDLEKRLSIYNYSHPSYKVQELVPELLDLKGNENILDVGCGNGKLLFNFAKPSHTGNLYGIDTSDGVFKEAKKFSKTNNLNINFITGDVQHLPFAPNSFDAVTSCHMIYHVPNIDLALEEMHRILKQNGKFILSVNSRDTKSLHIKRWKKMVAHEFHLDTYPKIDERFNIENGEAIIKKQFPNVQLFRFESKLVASPDIYVNYFDSLRSLWPSTFSDEKWQEIHNYIQDVANSEQKNGTIIENNIFGIFLAIK